MEDVLHNIQEELKKYTGFSAHIKDTFLSKELIIKVGDSERFKIEELVISGYIMYYTSYSFPEYKISITIPTRSKIYLWNTIQTLIDGQMQEIKESIDKQESELEKVKTAQEVADTYSQQEGDNMHEANTLLLAIKFGDKEDVDKIKTNMATNDMAGYTLEDYSDIHDKLYPKYEKFIKKIETKEDEEKAQEEENVLEEETKSE